MKENAIEIKKFMHQLSRTEILFNKKSLLHFHRNKVDEFQAIRNVSF